LKGVYSWGCPLMTKNHSNRVSGHSGYGCELYAKHIAGTALVNGLLTTGQMQFASADKNSTENYNYTDRHNQCGHKAAMAFSGKPDSVYFWCKFMMKKPSNVAAAKFFIHGDVDFKDVSSHKATTAQKGKIATAFCFFSDPNDHKWHKYKFPFTYFDAQNHIVSTTSQLPKYILAVFSTNKAKEGGNAGDKLVIDDIEMIYNKRLSYILIDGNLLPEFDPDVREYTLAVTDQSPCPVLTAACQSPHAKVSVRQDGSEAHITVFHDDGQWDYVIHFVPVDRVPSEQIVTLSEE